MNQQRARRFRAAQEAEARIQDQAEALALLECKSVGCYDMPYIYMYYSALFPYCLDVVVAKVCN